ncbi:hypothetical protein Sste5346_003009 [Sporothrix stenoceras]|uniref:DASH complex subunit ASK1 n=1 Tax=Sporothrix stenoceras TaxID=5173 RepID=A0ABR3ZFX0_9PEZI
MAGLGGSLANRPLSTTEELEKLEQSITLTLQEIDHNFSRAHRIVTGSILPVVEQYGEHCRSVWDASKFWKQFFEAAANVSLSGYEELANDEGSTTGVEETTTTDTHDDTTTDYTARARGDDGDDGDQTSTYHNTRDESLLSDGDGDLSGSTPRPPTTKSLRPQFAELDSPYENLRREMNRGPATGSGSGSGQRSRSGSRPRAGDTKMTDAGGDESTMMRFDDDDADMEGDHRDDSSAADSELLAQHTARLPNMSMTPRQSLDERNRRALEDEQANARRQKDPLMHRVLGKDYRIQATPHKNTAQGISPMRLKVTDRQDPSRNREEKEKAAKRPAWQESSPMSSPEIAVPKLRSAAFMSPMRAAYRNKLTAAVSGPRTPGVSVQTPARNKPKEIVFDDIETTETVQKSSHAPFARTDTNKQKNRDPDEIRWESSDEDGDDLYGGMSPPKTINFALPPSKLLQTPAREASKRIVEDILLTAGEDLDRSSEYSPTMVKMNADILDETF